MVCQAEQLMVQGGRVVGVQARHERNELGINAKEVVLCAGALGSPQLLLKSGIGAPGRLEKAQLTCVHALPGVGENLQDHLQLRQRVNSGIEAKETREGVEQSEEDMKALAVLSAARPKFRVQAPTLNSQVGELARHVAVGGFLGWAKAALSPAAWRYGFEFLAHRTGPVSMAASQVCAFVASSRRGTV